MADALLRAEGLALRSGGAPFDVELRPGEIVGLAGLDGHGQDAFLEVAAGVRRAAAGRIVIRSAGADHPLDSLRQAAALGVAYLPRDRRATGIFPTLSVLDNFAIASIGRDVRAFFIDRRARYRRYKDFAVQLSIVAGDAQAPITALSGGNQQKVLLARSLALDPAVLLLNDPTRGVDVATRRVLYDVFRTLARKGMSLALLSTEIEEIAYLCDRVLVFRDHALAAHLDAGALTGERIIAAMFGRAP